MYTDLMEIISRAEAKVSPRMRTLACMMVAMGFTVMSGAVVWMTTAIIGCFSRSWDKREWSYDNAGYAYLAALVGWALVAFSGIPLLVLR